MKRKRWDSVDVLRICSLLLIFLYHFMVEIEAGDWFYLSAVGISYENQNLHMAKVGVTLFFMISGFGLMHSNRQNFDGKTYWKKRFIRILIPYYVVFGLVFLGRKIMTSGSVWEESIPIWHFLFTLLGLDGYLKEFGVSTYHLGVGEWFIGCLILMYLVFPLLRKALLKKADLTIFLAAVIYLIYVFFYRGIVPSHYAFVIKLYEFFLGMYLAVRLEKTSEKQALIFGVLALVLLFLPWTLPLKSDYRNTIFCLLVFLFVFHMENTRVLKNICKNKMVGKLSQYSYEIFLVHHWVIILMNRILKPDSLISVCICLGIELIVVFVAGGMLHSLIKKWTDRLN